MMQADLCQRIVEQTQEAIIYADRDGLIRLWNQGATTMFGYKSEETIGQSLDLIIPERLRARHWQGYRHVMETGVTRYGSELLAVPAIRKDGQRLSIEFTIVLMQDTNSNPIGTAALIRDVTTRWQQEKAQRERIAALEAKIASLEKGEHKQ
jgi:PAS domain S-box-containing protein